MELTALLEYLNQYWTIDLKIHAKLGQPGKSQTLVQMYLKYFTLAVLLSYPSTENYTENVCNEKCQKLSLLNFKFCSIQFVDLVQFW